MGQTPSKRVSGGSSTVGLTALAETPSEGYTAISSSPTPIPSSPDSPTTPTTPASIITQPSPPPRLRRISELIDPQDLFNASYTTDDVEPATPGSPGPSGRNTASPASLPLQHPRVLAESPSGNKFLTAEEFMAQGERPLSMRERQELIAHNTRLKLESRAGSRGEMRLETRLEERSEAKGTSEGKRRSCWCCWC